MEHVKRDTYIVVATRGDYKALIRFFTKEEMEKAKSALAEAGFDTEVTTEERWFPEEATPGLSAQDMNQNEDLLQAVPMVLDEPLPPGEYLVTDPCYVFDDPFDGDGPYARACRITLSLGHGTFRAAGRLVHVFRTSYGDGEYPVYVEGLRQGDTCVDSGQVAMIPKALADLSEKWREYEEKNTDLGEYVRLAEHTRPERLAKGDFRYGDEIEVYTSDEDPYYHEESDDEDDLEDEDYYDEEDEEDEEDFE